MTGTRGSATKFLAAALVALSMGGATAQSAAGVTEIGQQVIDVVRSSHIAARLLDLFDSSQFAQGRVARFRGRHPFCDLFFDQLFQMETKLVSQFLLDVALSEERTESERQHV